jgi:putative DNA-invertase from lambdoid prophage Rac
MPPKGSKREKKLVVRPQKVYWYIRCSTDKQDVLSQQNGFEEWLAADKKLVVTDKLIDEAISGTVPWRDRKIGEIVDDAQAGDYIVVAEISRLGRIMSEVLTILDACTKKGVTVIARKGNITIDGSMAGKMMGFMLALVAEIERDQISLRTREGMMRAKQQGKIVGGRRPGWVYKHPLDPFREKIREQLAAGVKQTRIAEEYKCSQATISLYIRKHELIPGRKLPPKKTQDEPAPLIGPQPDQDPPGDSPPLGEIPVGLAPPTARAEPPTDRKS